MSNVEVTNITKRGVIEVRETITNDDGSVSYHRHTVSPDDPTDNEDEIVKAVAAKVHTKQVVDDYKAIKAAKIK